MVISFIAFICSSVDTAISEICFALLRHVRTEWNARRKIQGWLDSPLTEQGVEVAEKWALQMPEFGFDAILCSDLGRTVKTAQILNRRVGLPVIRDSRLREQYFGPLQGQICSGKEYRELKAAITQKTPLAGVESLNALLTRGMNALLEYNGKPGQRVLVVSH